MNGVSKVANGNELESGSDSAIKYSRHWQWGTTDYIESWLESVQLKVAMRDRRVCSEMDCFDADRLPHSFIVYTFKW